jgi:hypothetical protein
MDFRASIDELLNRAEGARAVFLRDPIGSREVGVNHGPQLYGKTLLLQLVIDTRVIASERAYANDCYVNGGIRCQGRSRRELLI